MDVTCIVEWVVALLLQEPVHHIIVGAQLAHILVPVLNNRLLRVMMELVLRRSAVLPTWIGSRELCDIDEHVDVKCEYMLTKLFVSAALHTVRYWLSFLYLKATSPDVITISNRWI
jgi:putative flippase GtrA